jgi:hypothetical protein
VRTEDWSSVLLLQVGNERAAELHRRDDLRPFLQSEAGDEHGTLFLIGDKGRECRGVRAVLRPQISF